MTLLVTDPPKCGVETEPIMTVMEIFGGAIGTRTSTDTLLVRRMALSGLYLTTSAGL